MKDNTLVRITGQVESLKIDSQEAYDTAEALGKVVAKEIKDIKAYFKPLKADAKKAWDNMVKAEKESLKPYETAKSILGRKMVEYEEEQERYRRDKERAMMDMLPEGVEPEDVKATATYVKQGQTRTFYELEVLNPKMFLEWVLVQPLDPEEFLTIKKAKVKEFAKEMDIPGIELKEVKRKVF